MVWFNCYYREFMFIMFINDKRRYSSKLKEYEELYNSNQYLANYDPYFLFLSIHYMINRIQIIIYTVFRLIEFVYKINYTINRPAKNCCTFGQFYELYVNQ